MRSIAYALIGCLTFFAAGGAVAGEKVDFTRDVRPILSQHCFQCHGPDEKARKAKLRLDVRESALAGPKSGGAAIIPGKPDESELIQRINAADESEMMPPPAVKKPLSDRQRKILRQWIAEGAEYKAHWAFAAPKKSPPPKVRDAAWPKNPIDQFVLARLEAAGLRPSPAADRYTLIRRVYLDLIGLPPTPDEAEVFARDASPNAYDKLVDGLLASPHYGERWARRWLDLARYADTNGYEKDRVRSMWPYRDWVIKAINDDMPFNQFTIDQIAGDMLPNASDAQRIATGFHRNTMINEEGGIDPQEFRFYAMTDRLATTGTAWLGLTIGCAQCHTHKFDPIPHNEYYQMMAFLNNADEPVFDVPKPDLVAQRARIAESTAKMTAELPSRFPLDDEFRWSACRPSSAVSSGGAVVRTLADGSLLLSGANPAEDVTTVTTESQLTEVSGIRLEALTDPSLPSTGPGRTPHGNFVLTELAVSVAAKGKETEVRPIHLAGATADFAQDQFPPQNAIDGKRKTGWAIHGTGAWNLNRTATFTFDKPVAVPAGSRWTIRLEQQYGGNHTLGRFRLSLGERKADPRPEAVRRAELLDKNFTAWSAQESRSAVHWSLLRPLEAKSNAPLLSILEDQSVLASGDQTKRDVYDVQFKNELHGITAVKLEVLPHPSLPQGGPGRVYYEGTFGDFFLTDLRLSSPQGPIQLLHATQSFAQGSNNAAAAIDADPLSGWSINGVVGRAHSAVFRLARPLAGDTAISLRMVFERYYASGLGRFRLYATNDPRAVEARDSPADVEEILSIAADRRTAEQKRRLFQHYLSVAPELASARQAIEAVKAQAPALPTTLVMKERPASNRRATHVHHRGEFLQVREAVEPKVLSMLPTSVVATPRNRLEFARWLVAADNPLVGRVTMNRQWQAFFGRGLVRTLEDFGFQGDPPTHPDLLDWLAVELVDQGWSMKKMHRLIVASAAYQQASRTTTELLEKDPLNQLLARGPRVRLDAELIRDFALRCSGLLSPKIGGPSVFPPQPPGVTSDGAYGALAWNVSPGEDRYRRGLYTFSKRTAPYAMFNTFDGPSGEACVARRDVSNTPLQALTLLNDVVFVEAAQALGRTTVAEKGTIETRATSLFRRCLTRPPTKEESSLLIEFFQAQKRRLLQKELNADAIAGPGKEDAVERAAWTLTARALLNLDETITKG